MNSAGTVAKIACRVHGQGSLRVLLLHALTGGPDAADRPEAKGWWSPLFREGAPLAENRVTVWTPNLPGSCYGSEALEAPTIRAQADALAQWLEAQDLRFEVLLGGSLGGMVALELALRCPGRFGRVGVIGCGARADAWLWGTNEIQRAILLSPSLDDTEAIALARRAAMLTFRTPASLDARFSELASVQAWLSHHGAALAGRFTRKAYLDLLAAMDSHDLGRDRGGLVAALRGFGVPLHILGLDPDYLFPRSVVQELEDARKAAGVAGSVEWLEGPHGHDAFLIEWDRVAGWLTRVLEEKS